MNTKGAQCRMPFEALVDYHDARADEATTARVQAHLAAGCDACDRQLARLGRMLGALPQAVNPAHAPESALASVRALFRDRFRAPARAPLIARLAFRRGSSLLPSAARGEADGGPTQLLYETDEHDVDLWAEPSPDGDWYLIGQVLPKSGAGAVAPERASLASAAGVAIPASLEGSEFHLASVPAGVYQLRLSVGEDEILVPDVAVGH